MPTAEFEEALGSIDLAKHGSHLIELSREFGSSRRTARQQDLDRVSVLAHPSGQPKSIDRSRYLDVCKDDLDGGVG